MRLSTYLIIGVVVAGTMTRTTVDPRIAEASAEARAAYAALGILLWPLAAGEIAGEALKACCLPKQERPQ